MESVGARGDARRSVDWRLCLKLVLERRESIDGGQRAGLYREVQLDLKPEIEVFHMLSERCHAKNRKISIKQHVQYF